MTRAWHDHASTIVLSLALLPAAGWLAVRALLWLRLRAGAHPATARRRSIAEVAVVAGTLPWMVMAFAPQPAAGSRTLVPLHDLATQAADDLGTFVAQVSGNLLFLAAFGFSAPIAWAALAGVGRLLGVAVLLSTTVEVLQDVLDIGRVSSVDDVLLNTVGAVVAGLAARRWWAARPTGSPGRRTLQAERPFSRGIDSRLG